MISIEINNRVKGKIDSRLVKKVVEAFGRAHKIGRKEISLAFVGDAEMKKLNQTCRGINQPTDILSFDGEGSFLGEIVIDYAQIKRQAGYFGQTVKQELVFILAHGLLHLIGYDDKTEKQKNKMIKLGEDFIKNYKLL